MPNPLRSGWRWLFPLFQYKVPVHYKHPLLSILYREASVFHQLCANGNYDPSINGEAWLIGLIRSQARGDSGCWRQCG